MWRGSLRRKLLLVVLLTTLVAVVAALGAMVGYDLRAYHRGWLQDLDTQAELLGTTSAAALSFDDARTAQQNLALLRLQPKVRAAALYDATGRTFATYAARPGDLVPARPADDGTRVEQGELVVFKPVHDDGRRVGTVFVRARYELYDRLANYAAIAALVTAGALALALALSARLQRRVTAPILEIAAVAQAVVQQRDYARRARRLDDDEAGELAQAFNEMLDEIARRTRELEDSNRDKAREVEERRHAQQEVMRLNAQLEQRVQERTAQLESSNRDLAAASAAAQAASRAKSEFLSSMSHELRTPLNAIIGFGQLLQGGTPQMPPERQHLFADHIVSAGRHLLALINEILNLAQIEAGRLSLSLEPVPLGEMLAECRTMVEPLAERRRITLNFPVGCPGAVAADRTRLRQVLLNLLSNAVKYNRDAGGVEVVCRRQGERLRVSVRDTGPGLAPSQLQALFQPFNRLGQEGGTQEGSGIGLVVTKQLVELMGGCIGVESAPGVGSEFWIELPLSSPVAAPAPLPAAHAAAPAAAPMARATVLCVEDNPTNLDLVEAILATRPDLQLLCARDGAAGVALARAQQPQVILMDNHMPGLSGHEAQALLRQDPATAHIPVIALTADAMPEAVQQGLTAGYFRYLTKPIDPMVLLEAVDSALAWGRTPRQPA